MPIANIVNNSNVRIQPLTKDDKHFRRQAAELLADAFPHCYGNSSKEEIVKYLDDERIALIAVEGAKAEGGPVKAVQAETDQKLGDQVIGLVGAIPQYGVTGWELHPLAVRKDRRFHGIGTMLVEALEKECRSRGGITIYLGSDDEFNTTTLSNCDLYIDTYNKIENIKNLDNHPYEFYQKLGYKIVGVVPDANGIGKPDIWMAKRINGEEKVIKNTKNAI